MKRKNTTWDKSIKIVLSEAREPMHYQDIAAMIGEKGLRSLGANAPFTVNAYITSSIKHDGKESPYERLRPGEFSMKEDARKKFLGKATIPEEQDEEAEDAIVNTYGLHWDRDKIKWNVACPKLLGTSSPGAEHVDFHDQKGVYILYNLVLRPVYVGYSTNAIGNRLKGHFGRLPNRWRYFSWFGLLQVDETGKLVENADINASVSGLSKLLESVLIQVVEPPLNRQSGSGGVEYLQAESPEQKRADLQKRLQEELGWK